MEVGIDIVKIERFKSKTKLAQRILSEEELDIYNTYNNENAKMLFLAGRFAAKEAIFKCFKKGDLTANYRDFIILNDESGAPYVKSKFLINQEVLISISHIDSTAISNCVLITKSKG